MIKLLISLFFLIFIFSCQITDSSKINEILIEKKVQVNNIPIKNKITDKSTNNSKNILKYYVVGDPYFIEGVKYIPEENYKYNEIGLATLYGKELHNVKTINNDFNKVTELLGRHKTLPLPSIVKVTNLENGLSIILKINDRHSDNSSILQVSRKSALLLKFYKNKITRVRVEILPEPSKQMKTVSLSMSEYLFNDTIISSPVEDVNIIDIVENIDNNSPSKNIEEPIKIGFEKISKSELFLKIYNFNSYEEIKSIIDVLDLSYKFTTQNEGSFYTLLIGPLENIDANNLVLSFISKGYKKTEFILE